MMITIMEIIIRKLIRNMGKTMSSKILITNITIKIEIITKNIKTKISKNNNLKA
jgi:hypothetical protein